MNQSKLFSNIDCYLRKVVSRSFATIVVMLVTVGMVGYCTMAKALAAARIKDIVYFEGVRDNILVGYGLVVGLNGTGDNLNNSGFTNNSLTDYLNRLGVSTTNNMANLNTKNVASVMVTANLPAFARAGMRVPVNIGTLGDAKSLKGGTLLATTMIGADGKIYAVAQGQISIGTMSDPDPAKAKPTPTSGYILSGAIVEREVGFSMNSMAEVRLALKNPDITTARSIATAINSSLRDDAAYANDPGTVTLVVPSDYRNNVVGLLADIESISVTPDTIAKVIIDEATGTVVIGDNVKINRVAVSQGNLVIKVSDEDQFNFLVGKDPKKEKPKPSIPGTKLALVEENATLGDLVQGLNSLGVKPGDLIAILKSIQQAGAMQAVIEVR